MMGDDMELDIVKESMIEYCENIYALGIGYLRNKKSDELEFFLEDIEYLEDNVLFVCVHKFISLEEG